MKLSIASPWFLSLGSLLAIVVAPAFGAATAAQVATSLATDRPHQIGLDPVATGLIPGMHGIGRGLWDGPDEGLGRLFAISTPVPGGPSFAFDANLARIVPIGPHGPEIEGTLFGEMRMIDLNIGVQLEPLLATILGGWTQDVDGHGTFAAQILVPTGDVDDPFALAGHVVGEFSTPPPDSGQPDEGVATLRWNIAN